MCLHIMYEMQSPDSFWKCVIASWPKTFSTPDYFAQEDVAHFHSHHRTGKIERRCVPRQGQGTSSFTRAEVPHVRAAPTKALCPAAFSRRLEMAMWVPRFALVE